MIATRPPARQLKAVYSLLYLLAMNRGGVRHSGSKGDYIWNANGRSVSDAQIQKQLDKLNDAYYDNVTRLAERLDSGNLSIPQWQERMRKEVKDVHRTNYIIGRGGVDKMTPRDWGRLGSDLRWMQYKALDGFALDIANGKRLPDGTFRPYSEAEIKARSRLYVNASNKQYWRGKTEAKMAAGFVEEQRFTHNSEPCNPCESEAAKGRQPIGTLAKPGEDCDGMTNCRCTMDYYKADGTTAAPPPSSDEDLQIFSDNASLSEVETWLSDNGFASDVDLSGLSEDAAREVGKGFHVCGGKYKKLQAHSIRTEQSFNGVAYYDPAKKEYVLSINNMGTPDKYKQLMTSANEQYKSSVLYDRALAPESISEAIVHEYNHALVLDRYPEWALSKKWDGGEVVRRTLDNKVFNFSDWMAGPKAASHRDYRKKLGWYSDSEFQEYIAESFVEYTRGGEIHPDVARFFVERLGK